MVGIADLPVAVISGLKSAVEKANAEHAAKVARPPTPAQSPENPSASDLNLGTLSIADSAASSRVDLSPTSTLNGETSATESDNAVNVEVNEVEPSILTPEKRSHTIQISTVHHATTKHSHHIEAGDKATHKAAVRAEKGATIAAAATIRPVMDFTMAVARGFHNAPKLYGDDTVRHTDKIIDFKTGMTAAGKEFGYGWYDGISGLVTQPFNGAKNHGVKGFLEGIGKGVSGLILKPGAGKFSS